MLDRIIIGAACVLCPLLWWATIDSHLSKRAEASPTRPQWEYTAVSVEYPKVARPASGTAQHDTPKLLIRLGREGWEMCGATALGRFHTYTFKRPK